MTAFAIAKLRVKKHSETLEGYWSIGLLGNEMGYGISTCQMQYDAAD